ncbi:MAG: DNA-methyltransferase [Gammaproteobacteria bacterium]
MHKGRAEDILARRHTNGLFGKVQLILTSPPFPLVRQKEYGNLSGQPYIDWLLQFTGIFRRLLKRNGSIVLEIGNAWRQGSPTMSLVPIKSLLEFADKGRFHLCQEFIWFNPARLPSPAQWVNVKRVRVKDSFTRFWWIAPSENPKSNNRRVLNQYSASMQTLLRRQSYNSGLRPSGYKIGKKSFLTNNGGSIPPNVLSISNTASNDNYNRCCQEHGLRPHPARMPVQVAEFFIKLLTTPGDLILDPFAGSNTTGYAAERHERYWVSIEQELEYGLASAARFTKYTATNANENKAVRRGVK